MNILVIGATGLFGSRLCTLLSENEHHVLAMTRDPQTAFELTTLGITGVIDTELALCVLRTERARAAAKRAS